MKKIIYGLGICMSLFSCANNNEETEPIVTSDQGHNHARCASHQILEQQIAADPSRGAILDEIEKQTEAFIRENKAAGRDLGTIQVVVNVIYKTAAQNISSAQIASQIDVLNNDFAGTNADAANTPAAFQGVMAGNTNINFVLNTVRRKSTNKSSWQLNDAMKKTAQGGLDPLNPTTMLNIWVCNLASGYLGYAQFPGGPASTDGVVIDYQYFGTTGTATAPFNLGRTATHEVGHWANLRHIWGDATCGSDLVSDTPTHNTSNYGCPAQPHYSTCSGAPREMTMNYMDYTDDACMYMFSAGQKARMQACMTGPRNAY